jgi:AcrR family transcriptional regulator
MERVDRRVKRTNKLLQDALVDLTLERGYDAVTIRDITERADVGYATFFRHYPDKDSLLADLLHAMKDDFTRLLVPFSIVSDPEHTGTLIFEYVQANCDLCRVLLNSTDTMSLLRPMEAIGQQEMAPLLEPARDNLVPVDVAADHLMSSLVMLIRWWLEHDLPYPPERMGKIAAELIIKPVLNAFSK